MDVILGFAEAPKKGDFSLKNFPSKIGGLPVWLVPLEDEKYINYFKCECGNSLTFLLQIYCPIDSKENSYHRMIYLFYCNKCWKRKDTLYAFRINLPETSKFYKGDSLLMNENDILSSKVNQEINSILKQNLLKEYVIITDKECKEASNLYINFYKSFEEHNYSSIDSNELIEDINDDVEIIDKKEIEQMDTLTNKFLKENPECNINAIESETQAEKQSDLLLNSYNDNIMKLFCNVVSFDKTQILRYYKNSFQPLWFNDQKMITTSNIKCGNCGSNLEFEFQVMPYIFMLIPEIANIDIGTIVVYTCKACCDSNGRIVQEYAYIQRTGENFRDLSDNDNVKPNKDKGNSIPAKANDNSNKGLFKGVNEKDMDEDGFIEVKKKHKKK